MAGEIISERRAEGRVSGERAVPHRRRRHCLIATQPEYLVEPADGARHPMVHPVQRHCRRERLPDRFAGGLDPLSASHLAMVARSHIARDISVVCTEN
jgi:hypothetical protein